MSVTDGLSPNLERWHQLAGHSRPPERLSVTPDGRTLISTGDRTIRIWEVEAGELRHCIDDMDPGGRQPVMTLDVSPQGTLLATGVADFTTKVYRLDNGVRLAQLSKPLRERFNAAEGLWFSPDGRQLACARGQSIELFETCQWTRAAVLRGHSSKIADLVYAPDGQTLISCGGKFIKLWDVVHGAERQTLTGHERRVGCLAVSPDGRLLAAGDDSGSVVLYSLPHGEWIGVFGEHAGGVYHIAFSPAGSRVASWDIEKNLCLWDAGTREPVWSRTGYEVARRVAFSPDGRLLAVAFFGGLHVLRPVSGTVVRQLGDSRDVIFSPQGDWLACMEGNNVVLWKIIEAAD